MWDAANDFLWVSDLRHEVRTRLFFASRVDTSCPCHAWVGRRHPNGYGTVIVYLKDGTQRELTAHRLAWILAHGYIEKKLDVLHICIHKHCVNVDHLYLGTQQMNADDWRHWPGLQCAIAVP